MIDDISYGIVPIRKTQNFWEFLVIHHQAGHWAFPKGHIEGKETPLQAAEREFHEETGMHVKRYVSDRLFQEKYSFIHDGIRVNKTVEYFLAEVGGSLQIQQEEIQEARWIRYEEALELITFDEGKNLLRTVWENELF